MIKRIVSLLFVMLLLTSCTGGVKEEDIIGEKEDYIDPINDIVIFAELDEELKKEIRIANGLRDYENYQFRMLGNKCFEQPLYDIEKNAVNLPGFDRFFMEVVSVNCSHCRKQLHEIASLIDEEIPFVQYFNVGTKEEILNLYREEGLRIPEKAIIIEENKELNDYVGKTLGMKSYPTLLAYERGVLTFDAAGELDEEAFAMIRKLAFEKPLYPDFLKEENGISILERARNKEDVRKDLSEENLRKLEELDHDDYTLDLSLQLMGKKADFSDLNPSKSDVYYNEVADFAAYENEKLVLFYTYLRDSSETEKVSFINGLISQEKDVSYIVVLIEGLESSSSALRNMNEVFHCPVVSVLGKIPKDFYSFGLVSYPTAVFIDRGTFTGAYSGVLDQENFNKAVELFLSDQCVAYKRNNG